jgi:peptide/nickel transport system substrate-binding protein
MALWPRSTTSTSSSPGPPTSAHLCTVAADGADCLDRRRKTVAAEVKDGDFGNAWLKTNSAGSGPFSIASYTPHEALVLQANPTSADKPKLESVIIRNVPDVGARRLLVEQGDADIARGLSADQIDALKTKPGVKVLSVPSARSDYILINSKANETLGNPAFWEAARYLVDYNGIAKDLLRGQSQVHQAFLPLGFPGAVTDTPFKLDVDKAKKILADAGIKTPFKVAIHRLQRPAVPVDRPVAAVDLRQGGHRTGHSAGCRQRHLRHGPLWQVRNDAALLDPGLFRPTFQRQRLCDQPRQLDQHGCEICRLGDPGTDRRDARGRQGTGPAKRVALYRGPAEEGAGSSPFVFMLQGSDQVVLSDKVKNYVQGLNADQVYYDKVEK